METRIPEVAVEHQPSNEDVLLPQEVAERLRVRRSWVYAHAPQIPGYLSLGRYVRFRRLTFEQWLEGTGSCQ